jgi:sugar lactone lactonase YvrE
MLATGASGTGTLYVSGGFWVAAVYRITRDGTLTTIATRLADPQGIAVDANGDVYLAESALHRIVRIPGR